MTPKSGAPKNGSERVELMQGTLQMLVLKIVELEPMHGYGLTERLEQITGGAFQVNPGSLFPALHKMEERGWLKAEWGTTPNNRRAKFYRLTPGGRRQLRAECRSWENLTVAINRVLRTT